MNTVIGSLYQKAMGHYQNGKRIATVAGTHLHHARLKNGGRVVLKLPQSNTLVPAQLLRFLRDFMTYSRLGTGEARLQPACLWAVSVTGQGPTFYFALLHAGKNTNGGIERAPH